LLYGLGLVGEGEVAEEVGEEAGVDFADPAVEVISKVLPA